MSKTLGWLVACLVAGVATTVWLRSGAEFREHSRSKNTGASSELMREHAELMRRVAALEAQMSRHKMELEGLGQRISDQAARSDSGMTASSAVIRQIENNSMPYAPAPGSAPRPARLSVESVAAAAAAAAGQPVSAPTNLMGLEAKAGQALVFQVWHPDQQLWRVGAELCDSTDVLIAGPGFHGSLKLLGLLKADR